MVKSGFRRKQYQAWTLRDDFWNKQRVARGCTYEDIAIKLGMNKQTITNYFYGADMPSEKTLTKLCNWWEVDFKKGLSEFRKLHKAYGESHPEYIDYYGHYRKPEWVEKMKERKKKAYRTKKNNTPSDRTKIVSTQPSCKKDKPYKAWSKIHNFWSDLRAEKDYTLEEVADRLGKHTLTIRAYFTGHQLPSVAVVTELCNWWGVDFNEGYEEFQNAHEDWGKRHPNYVKYGNTWVTKGSIETKRKRDNKRHMYSNNQVNTKREYWQMTDRYKVFCKYVYGILSYEDYTEVSKITNHADCMKFIKDKVDEDLYKRCSRLRN